MFNFYKRDDSLDGTTYEGRTDYIAGYYVDKFKGALMNVREEREFLSLCNLMDVNSIDVIDKIKTLA